MKKTLFSFLSIVSIISFSQTDHELFKLLYIKKFGKLQSDSLCEKQIAYSDSLILNKQYIYPYQSLMMFESFENEIWPCQTFYYLLEEKYNIVGEIYSTKIMNYPLFINNTTNIEYCLDLYMYNKIIENFGPYFFKKSLNEADELEKQNIGVKHPVFNIKTKQEFTSFLIKHSKFKLDTLMSSNQSSIRITLTVTISKNKKILNFQSTEPNRTEFYSDLYDDFKNTLQKIQILKPALLENKPIDFKQTFSIFYNESDYLKLHPEKQFPRSRHAPHGGLDK